MTREEILQKLRSDQSFAINFLLHNNFPGVQAALATMGYPVNSEEQAYAIITGFINTKNTNALNQLSKVKYINSAPNDTGRLMVTASNFKEGDPAANDSSFDWGAIGNAVGGVIGGIFGIGPKQPTTNNQSDLIAYEQAKAESNKTILIYTGIFLLLLVGIIGGVVLLKNKKTKKE